MTTRRKLLSAVLAVGLAFAMGAAVVIESPSTRTKFLFGLHRKWIAHWPLQQGKDLFLRLGPVLQPFVPVRVQVEPGINMLLDPDDYVSRGILENGVWEPETWQAVAQHLQSGGTFVDVGAHIGYYSLKAAVVLGPTGHVIAVEPNPQMAGALRDNIHASGATIVAVQPVACSDSEATLEFFASAGSNTGESSLSLSNASQGGQPVRSYRVRARPLDAIIQETGVSRVDVLKIDVEGAELLVLKGAQKTLGQYHPVVIVELVESQLSAMGTSSAEIVEFLRSQGYTARHTSSEFNNTEFAAEKRPPQAPK
jgi:FkbM family methyltransferase